MPSPTPTPEIPHTLVGAFYDVQNFPNAKLLLNNKDTVAREVRPTLYSLNGQILEVPPVQVEAQSFRLIDLRELAKIGGDDFRQGNIKLFHTGKDLVLGTQIYLEDAARSLSFEEKLSEIGTYDSRRLEGVWFQPSNQTESKIVLTNTSNQLLNISATLSRRPNILSAPQTFILQPHSTRLINLRETFGNTFANSDAVGISLTHDGTPSALLARAMIGEITKGYSTVVTFSNPNRARSNELHGAGLRLGSIGGDRLSPVIVLRNTSNEDQTVNVRVPYSLADGTNRILNLPVVNLRGNEIKKISFNDLSQSAEKGILETAGIEIKNQSENVVIIAQMQSISQSRAQSFRTLLWDAQAQKSPTGGYPWLVEENSATNAYIKNVTDETKYYVSYLTWENGGMYMIGLKQIAAHQTVKIDVKKLRDQQIPDEEGRMIPPDISKGQIQWTAKMRGTSPPPSGNDIPLVGQMEQTDTVSGISTSYFCQNCCEDSASGTIGPTAIETEEDFVQYQSYAVGYSCYNGYYSYQTTNDATWTSSDTNVANSLGYGLFETIGAGQTTIKAEFEVTDHFTYGSCEGGPYLAENRFFIFDKYSDAEKNNDQTNLVPEPCDCLCENEGVSPNTQLKVKPEVTIAKFDAVGKNPPNTNFSATVEVIVRKNPNDIPITLTLAPDSGTGEANFVDKNGMTIGSTMSITKTKKVQIKGITESSTKDNMRLTATFINSNNDIQKLGDEDFTVISVILSLRYGNNDMVSSDNSKKSNYQTFLGTMNLGGPFLSSGSSAIKWRIGIEIVGTILPTNFRKDITLQREIVSTAEYTIVNETTTTNLKCEDSSNPPCPDTSDILLLDTEPNNGKVFDLDAPGAYITTGPMSVIFRRRKNYRQWATISQNNGGITENVRVSDYIAWFQRESIHITDNQNTNQVLGDVTGDNQNGAGTTSLSSGGPF